MTSRGSCQRFPGRWGIAAVFVGLLACGAALAATSQLPAVSPDGLRLVPQSKVSAFYLLDGADFSGYRQLAILDCQVAFRKNWKRDQNSFRVDDGDMARIKSDLAAQFKEVFVRELSAKGETLTTIAGPDVLILRPAIVDLDVAAPDTMEPGARSFSASAGRATLVLEFYDSVSGELLARGMDAEAAGSSGRVTVRNGVTNRRDAEMVLSRWARTLATFLENARKDAKPTVAPGQ